MPHVAREVPNEAAFYGPKIDYANGIVSELRAQQVRAELEFSNDKLMGRSQRAREARFHQILVVGQREQEANAVAVRIHGQGQQGVKPRAEVEAGLLAAIREQRAQVEEELRSLQAALCS